MIYNLGNRAVNNYLVPITDGYILIDTRYADGLKRFCKKIKAAGIDPHDIKYIFLTHAHDDHAGFLNEVLSVTDAKVILHPKAIEGLKRGQNSFEGGCSGRLAHFFCGILKMLGKGEHRFPSIDDKYLDRLVTVDSAEFSEIHFPYQVIETPGHTADHISLKTGDDLFCGDAAMNNFPSIKRVIIWIEDLQQYKRSWETIIDMGAVMIYPSHGKPFRAADLKKYLSHLDKVRLYPLKSK